MIGLVSVGTQAAVISFSMNEQSPIALTRPFWVLKAVIPVAALLLCLQGLAEVGRCVLAIRAGSWPERPALERPARQRREERA